MKLYTLICAVCALCHSLAFGNNLQISNITLTGKDTIANTYQVQFDIAWENSWRTSTLESNYDAVWVFIKFRIDTQTDWQRGLIASVGFVAPAGAAIDVSADAVGAFIFRSASGIGNVNYTGVQLQWNYGGSGIADDAIIEICVQGIEMVYVPTGAYSLGDNSASPAGTFAAGNSGNPFVINSENALTLGGTVSTNLSNNNAIGMLTPDDYNYTTTQPLPAAYPKGFNEFYIQKYEISQDQYTAFLNKLPPVAATNRFPNQAGQNGHTIANTGVPPNVYVTTTPDRACNFLSWADLAAYADWSGLRPMSELEYEKACRGTRAPVVDEGAWGNSFAFNAPYLVANNALPNEVFTNPGTGTGNCLYSLTRPGGVSGVRRCGIFAASAVNKTRQETGGTYYGVMDMSGNVWEMVVNTSNPTGRSFTGLHGNGIIGATGSSTVGGWPAITGANEAVGIGVRGGGNGNPLIDQRVSTRRLGGFPIAGRFSDVGGRLVRSSF